NCVQVPALQALLLFSRSLDTSADCAWLVVDGWLEITIPNAGSALCLLSTALQLRSAWKNLLHQLLEGWGEELGRRPSSRDVSVLSQGLLEFLSPGWRNRTSTSVPQLWLLLPGLFQGTEMKPDEVKGGHRVMTDFLTYNCLTDMDLYSDCLRSFWTCPHCNLHMPFTPPGVHVPQKCLLALQGEPGCVYAAVKHSSKPSALHRSYHCNVCQQDFTFTPTEILRHKKQHR
uniref:DHX34-like C2H2-type zinc finger domain-containing protein n=1 Tax=Accipiter nisus TaxID=211598 RepID=A0A8B9MTD7_9AVES